MSRNKQVVPAFPEPYIRKKRHKKPGPKKNYDKVRSSPSMRAGTRYKTVCLPEEAYYMLKELSTFYKVSMGVYVYSLLLPAFDHATEESRTLQRIAENREKAEREKEAKLKELHETQNRTEPTRRTHF